ncbi:hypothetical protein MHYP_G00213280 [Metynnis hypsauchen]
MLSKSLTGHHIHNGMMATDGPSGGHSTNRDFSGQVWSVTLNANNIWSQIVLDNHTNCFGFSQVHVMGQTGFPAF